MKKRILMTIPIVLIIISIIIGISIYKEKKETKSNNNENILEEIEVPKEEITETKSERMLQLEQLHKENKDIIGWLEIPDTNINYPVLHTNNNDYYMNHNYKKEYYLNGSLFLDKDFDLINGSTNYLIYGHSPKDGTMFDDLIKYAKEDFYKTHKTIIFTTLEEESKYEVVAAFYSRVYYQSETNVFRYYFFVNANNEKEFNNYISNAKKASLYDTGITPKYKEQLMTLSTCSYHRENGRFAVVLRKVD